MTLDHSLVLPENVLVDIAPQPIVYYTVIQGEVNNTIDANDNLALADIMNYNTTGTWGGDCPDRIEIEYYTDCDILNNLTDNVIHHNLNPFDISPNPASDKLRIASKQLEVVETIEQIEIYSINGELLKSFNLSELGERMVELDVSFINQSQLIVLSIITAKNKYNEIISITK